VKFEEGLCEKKLTPLHLTKVKCLRFLRLENSNCKQKNANPVVIRQMLQKGCVPFDQYLLFSVSFTKFTQHFILMTRRILPLLLTAVVSLTGVYSCKKAKPSPADPTMSYFPLTLGKYVTYNVDSTIFIGDTSCRQYETRTQLKYVISDTFRDASFRLSYMIDVFARPHDGGTWEKSRVILLTPAPIILTTTTPPAGTPVNQLLYSQDNTQFIKLVFPIQKGVTWQGNNRIDANDPAFTWYRNWNYTYTDVYTPYNNGDVTFDNTVTVLENDESVNYPHLDSALQAYRTYAKEVYAYNIGMVYKEWTHWSYDPAELNAGNKCVTGFTVVMRAVDHN
jgi:hypothetical protein